MCCVLFICLFAVKKLRISVFFKKDAIFNEILTNYARGPGSTLEPVDSCFLLRFLAFVEKRYLNNSDSGNGIRDLKQLTRANKRKLGSGVLSKKKAIRVENMALAGNTGSLSNSGSSHLATGYKQWTHTIW